jgi:hypothetical protein
VLVCKCGKAKQVGSTCPIVVVDDIGVAIFGALSWCGCNAVVGFVIIDGANVDQWQICLNPGCCW